MIVPSLMTPIFRGLLIMTAVSVTASLADDRWTPELMMRIQRIGSVQVSPDGQHTAFAVRTAVMNDSSSEFVTHIHRTTPDGNRTRQLTQGEKSCDDPQWSPDGNWLAFISARSGTKNVWLIPSDGGEAFLLTDIKAEVSSFKWAPDGRSLAFTALDPITPSEEAAKRAKHDVRIVDQNIKKHRLYVVPMTSPPTVQREPKPLTPAEMNVGGELFRSGRPPFDWSPDGRRIVLAHTKSPVAEHWTTSQLAVIDVSSAEIRPLAQTEASESTPCFSPDGTQIAYVVSDDPPTWAGRRRLAVIPAAGGSPKLLADTHDDFGRYSELIGWAADGNRLYYTEMHGTSLKLMAMPLQGLPSELGAQTHSPARFQGMSLGGVFLNSRRTHLGFSWEALNRPPEAVVTAIAPWKIRTVSHIQDAVVSLRSETSVWPMPPRTDVIRWKSDDLEIEGLLTYPKESVPGKRYPLLVVIHGGPMGVFTQQFDGSAGNYPIAAFAERGYAVLRANVRGSSGYGAKFRYANYNDWGGGDYRDIMAGVDHVIQLGIADADRMGVMGWSYGGYMTSWIITQTNRFRAASVGAGVTNLVSFTGTADIPGFLPDYFRGEFWDDLETYRKHSPMFHVKGVRAPTLIQHGERDERVPLSQGQELYNALKRQGCTTEMVIYPRTPHGIEEPRLLLDCMERNLEWFDRYLRTP